MYRIEGESERMNPDEHHLPETPKTVHECRILSYIALWTQVRNRHQHGLGFDRSYTVTGKRPNLLCITFNVKQCHGIALAIESTAAFRSRLMEIVGPWNICLLSVTVRLHLDLV